MNTLKPLNRPDTIRTPFIAFLRECKGRPGSQYLTFDGENYAVVIFADAEHAERYRDGMTDGRKKWASAALEISPA